MRVSAFSILSLKHLFFLKCGICNIFCDYLSTPTRPWTRADHLLQPKRGHSSLGLTWYGSSSTLQIGYSICETKIKRLLHNPQLLRFVYTLRKVTAYLLIVDLFLYRERKNNYNATLIYWDSIIHWRKLLHNPYLWIYSFIEKRKLQCNPDLSRSLNSLGKYTALPWSIAIYAFIENKKLRQHPYLLCYSIEKKSTAQSWFTATWPTHPTQTETIHTLLQNKTKQTRIP